MLDEGAQGIAVGADQHALAGAQLRDDPRLPIGQDAGDRVLEALGLGDRNAAIALVLGEVPGIAFLGQRRRDVEAAAPDLDLLLAVPGTGRRHG